MQVINHAARTWGIECLRYEIKDIVPPPGIVEAMELQAEAERRKRAQVLESEGVRQAQINESEARRVRTASPVTCCAHWEDAEKWGLLLADADMSHGED